MVILQESDDKLYTPKESSELTGIDKETLRKYTEYFNVQTQWTQTNNKGHRRYTKKNLEELIAIREKIKDQNWSWKQTLSWRNGESDILLQSHEEKSNLEKKLDSMLEQQLQSKQDTQEQTQAIQELTKMVGEVLQQNNKLTQENRELINEIREYKNSNDTKLLEQKTSSESKKTNGWFSRLLSK